jgi:hypothetical protein
VRGRVEFPKKSSSSYKVKLYWNNMVIDSHSVKGKLRSFTLHLKRNEVYGLVLIKRGYYQRIINIDTHISDADSNIYLFDFETNLIKRTRSGKLDKDALDYPIAIVSYDDRMIGFYYNEEYTSEIKRNIYGRIIRSRYSLKKM